MISNFGQNFKAVSLQFDQEITKLIGFQLAIKGDPN